MVPSSTTVQRGDATCSPTRFENAELPLRLKSPSRPCPTASWSKTPGQPGPRTTGIGPAGASTASKFTSAMRTASLARFSVQSPSVNDSKLRRPPPPALPRSRRPLCSTMTETSNRTRGRISAANVPSLAITKTDSWLPAMRTVTSLTLSSCARAV